MKLIEHTSARLAFCTPPNWAMGLAGLMMLLIAFFIASVPGKLTRLDCVRTGPHQGTCSLTETYLLKHRRVVQLPLRLVTRAFVQPVVWHGHEVNYRLGLELSDGDGSYWLAWLPDGLEARTTALALNEFLANPSERTHALRVDGRPFYFAAGALLGLLGLLVIAWGAQSLTASFHRDGERLTVRRRGLVGGYVRHVPWGAIARFQVADWRGDSQLYAVLHSGEAVRLSSSWDARALGGPTRVQARRRGSAALMQTFCAEAPPAPAEAPPAA